MYCNMYRLHIYCCFGHRWKRKRYEEVRFVVWYGYFYNLFRVRCERSDILHCVYTTIPSERRGWYYSHRNRAVEADEEPGRTICTYW